MAKSTLTVCLNMIVKDEAAIIERCLQSVVSFIDCWVICDTGSDDGTPAVIESFFAARGVPGALHRFAFQNFEQARNEALERARLSQFDFDYLLLVDADMELVVGDAGFRERLGAPCYRVLQKAPTNSYWNTRLLRRDATARYKGVTHEYLEVMDGQNVLWTEQQDPLMDIWFVDHACGSSHAVKFERDIHLLREALEQEPANARYWFYLAQSYQDAGRMEEAAHTFARRAEMAGFEEERWYARWQEARCLLALGREADFEAKALEAYNLRPTRAEPLVALCHHYRQRGEYDLAYGYAHTAVALPLPNDVLFVDESVYRWRALDQLAVIANWLRRYDEALQLGDRLLAEPTLPPEDRRRIEKNQVRYLGGLADEVVGAAELVPFVPFAATAPLDAWLSGSSTIRCASPSSAPRLDGPAWQRTTTPMPRRS